jgi:transposase
MDRIFDLLWELDGVPQIMPESKSGKGIRYVLNQESRMRTCLSDARIPLDNNDSERDLRHVILGRKNWQIFASPWAGEVACRLYSLMLSCRQNDINPEAYLADVLMAAETTPSSQVASLTPWAWAARQEGAALAE